MSGSNQDPISCKTSYEPTGRGPVNHNTAGPSTAGSGVTSYWGSEVVRIPRG